MDPNGRRKHGASICLHYKLFRIINLNLFPSRLISSSVWNRIFSGRLCLMFSVLCFLSNENPIKTCSPSNQQQEVACSVVYSVWWCATVGYVRLRHWKCHIMLLRIFVLSYAIALWMSNREREKREFWNFFQRGEIVSKSFFSSFWMTWGTKDFSNNFFLYFSMSQEQEPRPFVQKIQWNLLKFA